MCFNKSAEELIRRRYSVRTYRPEKLSPVLKAQLKKYAASIKGPFAAKVRLELIDHTSILEKVQGKIGTYGVIKGAENYVAAIAEAGDKDLEQLGYTLEKFILYAASLNLGTCWLGGTFKRSEFAKLTVLKENEIMPAVTPVGYPADKKSTVESLMRFAAGSNHRKPWQELFFNESFNRALQLDDAHNYKEALEAVRRAPSASNKQPWRILKKDECYHFFLKPTKGYGKALGFDIQRIDIGIAMCHFEVVLDEAGIKGSWRHAEFMPAIAETGDMQYIASWIETAKQAPA